MASKLGSASIAINEHALIGDKKIGAKKTVILDNSGNQIINFATEATLLGIKTGTDKIAGIPTSIVYGQKTIVFTGTAVQLDAGACSGVIVQALAENSGNVVIGDSAVTVSNGFQLQPGQAAGIAIDNVNKLYVNGAEGDGVCWIGS